jgi:D-alanine-D-alanine ligase
MDRKVIGIAHNVPVNMGEEFCEASLDVLTQVESLENSLLELGHVPVRIPFTRDIRSFLGAIEENHVEMVFNLCETVDENPQLGWHPAALLELIGIPFSGSPSSALMITTDKLLTKQLLKTSGIKTPNWRVFDGMNKYYRNGIHYPALVKPRFEDASIGIDQESIFPDGKSLTKKLGEFSARFGSLVIEEYIEGREFNISVFGYPEPMVLPPAEIEFVNFPDTTYRIVGYRAKWDKDSFEYHNTPRSFPTNLPEFLLRGIEKTALECARAFMLRDYARVDMRIDGEGNIYVLEINANPCLSPDAGFPAAVEFSGMPYIDMVRRFVGFMIERSEGYSHQALRLA